MSFITANKADRQVMDSLDRVSDPNPKLHSFKHSLHTLHFTF